MTPWDGDWQRQLDTSGLRCPLPVLRARKVLAEMPAGAVLRMRATDPAAAIDVPHFCAEAGHTLLASRPDGDGHIYFVRRAEG
jgi:tRNA 2-thiouridine synthesizing protein A